MENNEFNIDIPEKKNKNVWKTVGVIALSVLLAVVTVVVVNL